MTEGQCMIQAVIFDLDGVITDTAEHHYLAWKSIADTLHINFTREFNENLKGVSRMDSLKLLLSQAEVEIKLTDDQLMQLAEQKNEIYQQLIESITPNDILPGINEFIAELQQQGIKTAIASASKNAFTVIDHLQLSHAFEVIVDARTIKNSKPDPEVFLEAASLLGVDPHHCIGIEDAVAGVQAIKSAEMFAVAIGRSEAFIHADMVLPNTKGLSLDKVQGAYIQQLVMNVSNVE